MAIDQLTDIVGWTLFHATWQIVLIAAIHCLILFGTRRGSPLMRYTIGCCSLMAIAAAMLVMLAIQVRRAVPIVADSSGSPQAQSTSPSGSDSALPSLEARGFFRDTIGRVWYPKAAAPSLIDRAAVAVEPHLPSLVVGWSAVVAVLLAWNGIGLVGVPMLVRSAHPLSSEEEGRWREIAALLGVSRTVRYLTSAAIASPITAGFIQPVLLLPVSLATHCSVEEIRSIIAHELMHVRRLDYFVNLVQRVVDTIFFFHPGVWIISASIRLERELCCDAVAMTFMPSKSAYARLLLKLVDLATLPRLALGFTGGSLHQRVRRIRTSLPTRGVNPLAFSVVLILCVTSGMAAGSSILKRGEAARLRHEMEATDLYDYVPKLLRIPRSNPDFREALIAGLRCAREKGNPQDIRIARLAEVISVGADPLLIWHEYLPLTEAGYPVARVEYPSDWPFADASTHRGLVKLCWQAAQSERDDGRRLKLTKASLFIGSMKRDLAESTSLMVVAMSPKFDEIRGISQDLKDNLRRYVSLSGYIEADTMMAWNAFRNAAVDGGTSHAVVMQKLAKAYAGYRRFQQIEAMLALTVAKVRASDPARANAIVQWLRINASRDEFLHQCLDSASRRTPDEIVRWDQSGLYNATLH